MDDLAAFETDIPARLDRLRWSRFHVVVVVSLGVTWMLDGQELTIVGAMAARLQDARTRCDLAASRFCYRKL